MAKLREQIIQMLKNDEEIRSQVGFEWDTLMSKVLSLIPLEFRSALEFDSFLRMQRSLSSEQEIRISSDKNGRVDSPGYLFGLGFSDVVGMNSMEKVDLKDLWEGTTVLNSSNSDEGTVFKFILMNLIKGRESLWEVRVARLTVPDCPTKSLLWTIENLNTWFDFQKDLRRSHDEAHSALKAKSLFLANTSHEIRTPMNAIIGMTYLLSKTPLTMNQAEYVETLEISAKNLLRIINDILDLSKIESGKMQLSKREFTLVGLIEDVLNLVRVPAEEKGVHILFELIGEVPKFLIGDDLKIKQILINLTNNAVKFTDRGYVKLTVKYRGSSPSGDSRIAFSVEDSGIGMSAEDQKVIFLPFVQGDGKSSRKYKGTGLGLSISKALVDLMGGEFKLESQIGVGTKMSFDLDLATKTISPLVNPMAPLLANQWLWFVETDQDLEDNLRNQMSVLKCSCHWVIDETALMSEFTRKAPQMKKQTEHFIFIDRSFWLRESVRHYLTHFKQSFNQTQFGHLYFVVLNGFSLTQGEGVLDHSMAVDFWVTRPLYPWQWQRQLNDLIYNRNFHRREPRKRSSSESRIRLEGRRILVVEDNEVNQLVVREILSRVGAIVTVANNGIEALQKIENEMGLFDIILMDLQMPELDGIETTKRIRELDPTYRTPIVAVTANAQSEEKDRCLSEGMNDYLTKPIEPDLLIKVLARWCNPSLEKESIDSEGAADFDNPENSGIDWELAKKNVAGNRALLAEMLEKFLVDYGSSAQQLRVHLREGKMVQSQRLLLSLKAVSGYLGFNLLKVAIEKLDCEIKNKNPEEINNSWLQLDDQIRNTLVQIQYYLKTNGTR